MPAIWVLFLVLSIVLNMVGKKAKTQNAQQNGRQNGQNKPVGRNAQPAQPAKPAARPRQAAPAAKPRQSLAQAMNAKSVPAAHEAKPLEAHIHTPVMGVEGVGTEGEDCCHEYMLKEPAGKNEPLMTAESLGAPEAQALLQGVIFSEILGRRHALRYGRKQE